MPPNRFESEVESFLEGSHGDRTHIKRADHPRLHHYAGRYYDRLSPSERCIAFRVVVASVLCLARCSEISHVILPRLVQNLKSHRWNCSVLRLS